VHFSCVLIMIFRITFHAQQMLKHFFSNLPLTNTHFSSCLFSKALHSLIEVSFHNGLVSDSSDAKEAWTLCNEVIDIIENQAKASFSMSNIHINLLFLFVTGLT
jgi:hypothetical protein